MKFPMEIDVLGVKYTVEEHSEAEDKYLKNADGYCDKTSRKIVLAGKKDDCDLDDFIVFQRKVLRHEIIHAYLFESGLHENFKHPEYGHDETFVDWIAVQFPKLAWTFRQAGCENDLTIDEIVERDNRPTGHRRDGISKDARDLAEALACKNFDA